jgi:hypothetical protein
MRLLALLLLLVGGLAHANLIQHRRLAGGGTTTSTSSTTTTGTTTTSPTTTTTIAPPYMMLAALDGSSTNNSNVTANVLQCGRVVAHQSFTGTKIATIFYNSSGSSQTCGVAIYPDSDAGTVLASTSGACPATGSQGVLSATGLTGFTITDDTTYRICACATHALVHFAVAGGNADRLARNVNAVVASSGPAANACTSGALPSTTGTISADNKGQPLVEVAP